jgi:23S rRNA pseudouridine955/2504/2580 synthase
MVEIETGRTHQIRAQAAGRGHPLLGDKKYGGRNLFGVNSLMLHAWRLEFPSGAAAVTASAAAGTAAGIAALPRRIEAPLPEAFREKLKYIFREQEASLNRLFPL